MVLGFREGVLISTGHWPVKSNDENMTYDNTEGVRG